MSRHKDRLGPGQSSPEPANPPVAAMESNIFSFVAPTEFVQLPSEGRNYPPEHPLFNQKTIEIKQMTAKEEDILTSLTLIQNGVALERLLESVIVDKSIDPQSLLVGDRNAIIISARVSGYGNTYKTQITCPQCLTQQKHSFDLNKINTVTMSEVYENLAEIVNVEENGEFSVVLPKSQLKVTLRLLTGRHETALNKHMKKNKEQMAERLVTTQLTHMISSVNGNSTQEAIQYVSHNLPSADSSFLRKIYKTIVPNIELILNFTCQNCGHSEDMEVPLSADFFWPDQ